MIINKEWVCKKIYSIKLKLAYIKRLNEFKIEKLKNN